MKLEDADGRPWTASTGWGWIVLIVALTSGVALPALGMYLAFWISRKSKAVILLASFTLVLLGGVTACTLDHFSLAPTLSSVIAEIASILWIVAIYSLRHEIIKHFRNQQGWELRIGPVFTLLFSVVYINYCLNPVTLPQFGKMTSLNLTASSSTPNLRK